MLYRVTHETRYRYGAPVSQCQSEVRMQPRALPWQTLLDFRIESTPVPASVVERKDYFGNDVRSMLIQGQHDQFSTRATSLVRVEPAALLPTSTMSWEAARETIAAHSAPETLRALEFVFDSPFVVGAQSLLDYALPSFPAGRPVIEAAEDLSRRIHREFAYTPASTVIETPLLETLRKRRGVCQDFAHVMIGALRSVGLAARYVSGYVRSVSSFQGSEASHAWVGVFVPDCGWIDFDPTNDMRPTLEHVTVAWGRDYGDVTPMKGVALGGGKQLVEVDVKMHLVE